MSRTQRSFLVAGVAVAAGAAGWGLGMLFAPASGRDLRRRLAWLGEQQVKTFSLTAERLLNDVTVRAASEIARAKSCCAAKTA